MNKKYKSAFSFVAPSNESIERIYNMTRKKRISYKPLLTAAMAIAIILSVAMLDIGKSQSVSPTETTSTKTPIFSGLAVMASAAEEDNTAGVDNTVVYKKLEMNEAFPYEMYIKAVNTKGMSNDERKAVFDQLKAEYQKKLNNRTTPWDTSLSSATSASENVIVMSAVIGSLKLSIENPEDVTEINVTNTSKYGNLVYHGFNLDSEKLSQLRKKNGSLKSYYPQTPVISFTAEEFNFENHIFFWQETEELISALGADINTPFSTFNDEITFTVKYKNGDIAKSVIRLEFNDNGNATVKVVE